MLCTFKHEINPCINQYILDFVCIGQRLTLESGWWGIEEKCYQLKQSYPEKLARN